MAGKVINLLAFMKECKTLDALLLKESSLAQACLICPQITK